MSHEQRPGRMRLVNGGVGQQPQANGADAVQTGPATVDAPVAAPPSTGKPQRLLALVFLFGCAVGGAILPYLGLL